MKHEKKALPHQGELPLAHVILGKAFTEVNKPLPGTQTLRKTLLLFIFKLRKDVNGEQ